MNCFAKNVITPNDIDKISKEVAALKIIVLLFAFTAFVFAIISLSVGFIHILLFYLSLILRNLHMNK